MNNVDNKFKVYSDLDGWQAPGGGTIPPALCVTNLKPDIVIMDEHTKTLHIYELTMPLINNIERRHTENLKSIPHSFLTLQDTPVIFTVSRSPVLELSMGETNQLSTLYTSS